MLKRIEAENFLSIKEIVVDELHRMDNIGITGSYLGKKGYSNGSGKSSLAEVVLYTLTGIHRYKTDAEVIRIGSRETRTKVVDIYKGHKIEMERFLKMKKGSKSTSSALVVKIDGEIKASSTREGQEVINKFLGITPEDYINSSFFRQKEYDELITARSSERIKFLEKFFKAYIFEAAKKSSAKKRSQDNKELRVIEDLIKHYRDELSDFDSVSDVRSSIKELGKNKSLYLEQKALFVKELAEVIGKIAVEENKIKDQKNTLEKRERQEKEIASIVTNGKKLKRDLELLSEGLKEIKTRYIQLNESLPESKEWTEQEELLLSNNLDRYEKLLVDIQVKKHEIESKNEDLLEIKKSNCPVCLRMIGNDLREKLRSEKVAQIELISESIGSLVKNANNLLSNISSFKKSKKEIFEIEGERKDILNSIENLLIRKSSKDSMSEVLISQMNELRKSLAIKKKDLGKLKKEEDFDEEYLGELKRKKLKVSSKLDHICENIDEANEEINGYKNEIEIINKAKKFVKDNNTKAKNLRLKLSDRAVLDDVFEKCRMEVVSVGLDEVQEMANDIISEIGATHKEIEFETMKETQKGDVKDSLEIYLTDEKGKRAIEGLCGGELDLVALSIRIALSRYSLMNMSSRIDYVFLDEVFGALDDNSREELITALNLLKEDFSQLFVISHTSLKDAFDYNLHVQMGKDGITRLKEE